MAKDALSDSPRTSVPVVISIDEMRFKAAHMLELAVEAVRLSGDRQYLREPIRLIRLIYEQDLKPAAHSARLDWEYLCKLEKAIERVEKIAERKS